MRERSMSYPLTARRAWLLLFGLVTVHEVLAKPGELLSEEVDRQLEAHRWLTILFGVVTIAHLYNLLPNRIDPYHWLARIAGR
jgi:hypothetical protein